MRPRGGDGRWRRERPPRRHRLTPWHRLFHAHRYARQGVVDVAFCRRRWPRPDVVRTFLREPPATGWVELDVDDLTRYLRHVPGVLELDV